MVVVPDDQRPRQLPLLAVPFFILAGNLMNNAGITNASTTALALVGWMKGGVASTSSAR
jgi:TRAP-type C4-dicarboxylate transport system permease large subunit